MQPAPTGWYHAEGDAEGTVRYWDGTQWVGGPVNSPSAAAPGAGGSTAAPAGAAAGNPAYAAAAWQAASSYGTYGYAYVPFVERCYPPDQLVTASRWRRFGASMLESVLLLCTLVIGWYIWLIFTAQDGQTPAKKILGMYVIRSDGSRAGGGYMALRELVFKGILSSILGLITLYLWTLLAPMWCLWDKDRQCLWDKMASTYVAHSPRGFKPSTANELMMMGQPAPAFRPRQ